jgi:hypothetical protein
MRKIGAIFGITALAAAVFSPLPAAAFGIHVGPFYFHFPFGWHDRHHLYLRTNPNDARTRRHEVNAARTDQTDREALATTETGESCPSFAPDVTNPPIDRIRQTVHPTAKQEAALDDLSVASSQARDVTKSSCPASVPLTPVSRLDAIEQRLNATTQAMQIVRSPLERFYQALSDEQKQQFNTISSSIGDAGSAADMAALCSQQASSFIKLPLQRIEDVVEPTAQQQSALDELKSATQKADDQLRLSCPTAVSKSPLARLDTIKARLDAVADAIRAIRPSLKNFYASLSDDQKAQFNMMGRGEN